MATNYVKKTNQNHEHFMIICLKLYINKLLDSYLFIAFMMAITIYVLFISDIKDAFLTKDVDFNINITEAICFGLFSIELILASLVVENNYQKNKSIIIN